LKDIDEEVLDPGEGNLDPTRVVGDPSPGIGQGLETETENHQEKGPHQEIGEETIAGEVLEQEKDPCLELNVGNQDLCLETEAEKGGGGLFLGLDLRNFQGGLSHSLLKD